MRIGHEILTTVFADYREVSGTSTLDYFTEFSSNVIALNLDIVHGTLDGIDSILRK